MAATGACGLTLRVKANKKKQKRKKNKKTHARNNKINGEKYNRKTQMETWKKRQKTSEAHSFRNTKIKTSYTLEDGHISRNT
jgi:hypothetical protein